MTDVFATLEAINFQSNSKLAKGLTNLFQDVLDYKEELSYDGIPIDRMRAYRGEAVTSFFKKTTIPKLKALVKAETGITFKDVVSFGGVEQGCNLMFAVDISFDNYSAAVETIERSTASGGSHYASDREIVKDMRSMCESLSLKTGKLSKSKFGNVEASAILYFDINTAFMLHDYMGNNVTDELTAGEVAAIVLHEIGHVVTMVEHSGDLYAVSNRISNLTSKIKGSKDPVALIGLMKDELVPMLKQLTKRVDEDPEVTKHLKSAGNTLITKIESMAKFTSQYYAEYEAENETWISTIGKSVLNIFLMWIVTYWHAMGSYAMMHLQYHIWDAMMRDCLFTNTNVEGGKSSDILATYNNSFLLERRADEYVSRHGYSAELAISLNKITKAMPYAMLPQIDSARLRRSTLWNMLLWVYRFNLRWGMFYGGLDPMGYENQYQRNRRILRNSYAAFRNTNVPKGVFNMWITNTAQCEAALKDSYVFVSNSELSKALRNTFFNVVNPVEWVRMLRNGKLTRDVEILDNRLDDMRNNELYYLAARLGS